MGKSLSEGDRELWRRFAHDVRPLRGAPPAAAVPARPEPPPAKPAAAPPPPAPPRVPERAGVPLVVGTRGAGLDDTSWRALSSGKMAPARRLDLHGLTLEAAFRALESFLHGASADRIRCVEIVTGHGRASGGGAIRREIVHWLNRPDLRRLLVAAQHPRRDNEGAVRLLLRRRREG